MDLALKEAKKALKKNEVPIGAVIVQNGKVVAKAHNNREKTQNALNHAELLCIKKACKKLKSWRLTNCTMFVTLEPCIMCAGGILNSRIDNLVIGCLDKEHGAVASKYNLLSDGSLNHKTKIEICENEECKQILKNFFSSIRKTKKDKIKN